MEAKVSAANLIAFTNAFSPAYSASQIAANTPRGVATTSAMNVT